MSDSNENDNDKQTAVQKPIPEAKEATDHQGDDDDDDTSHFPISTPDPAARIGIVIGRYRRQAERAASSAPASGGVGVAYNPPFEDVVFTRSNLRLVSVDVTLPAHCTTLFELRITAPLCSTYGQLQGAAFSLIFDLCSGLTIAPVVRRDFWYRGGPSRNLNCTYLRAVPLGTEVLVESEIKQIGRRVATVSSVMKRKDDPSKLLGMADHHIVAADLDNGRL